MGGAVEGPTNGGGFFRRAAVAALLTVVASGCSSTATAPDGSQRTRTPGATRSAGTPSGTATPATERPVPRPPIVDRPIPFPASRKREMTAYAVEHYGLDTYRLHNPHVIVEHYTGGTTFESAYATFASNQPDLGELPGTCAHFVVDMDGRIYQLVPLDIMCRHTVGLNWTAIGIEMVGQSDREILTDPPQLSAVQRLTVWLMQRFHVQLRNVIGHNESLTSPYHHDRVPSFRCQTHSDWNHADMNVFRRRLARVAATYAIPLGPSATPVDSGC